jgi:glutathione S-transferase
VTADARAREARHGLGQNEAMPARLLALATSHPAHSARLMLEHKGVDHRISNLVPGLHPLQLRALGFRGATVPALRIDGRRIQGSREISRALDALVPEPALFPSHPRARARVEEAERWGEQELQELPRRLFRWAAADQLAVRRWLAEVVGLPAPGLAGAINLPIAMLFARRSQAAGPRVRADLARLPGMLDHVDELIATGVIGGAPTAADFQIAPSVRLLMSFDQLRAAVAGRSAGELATRLLPRVPEPIPAEIPSEWLGPLESASAEHARAR